jgi:hypothetical protein
MLLGGEIQRTRIDRFNREGNLTLHFCQYSGMLNDMRTVVRIITVAHSSSVIIAAAINRFVPIHLLIRQLERQQTDIASSIDANLCGVYDEQGYKTEC